MILQGFMLVGFVFFSFLEEGQLWCFMGILMFN